MGIEIGLLHVRRSIFIETSPARVWEEFESYAKLDAWFGLGHALHAYAPILGGNVDLSVPSGEERAHYGGPIIVFEPARELTIENNWVGENRWPVPTFLTIRLEPLYDGTLVELFHHGFERLGADAANQLEGYEEGWSMNHPKALRSIVDA
jgi:uncharacterized protein YndB with AHSA1/START domain